MVDAPVRRAGQGLPGRRRDGQLPRRPQQLPAVGHARHRRVLNYLHDDDKDTVPLQLIVWLRRAK